MNGPRRTAIVLLAAALAWSVSVPAYAAKKKGKGGGKPGVLVLRHFSEPADWELVRFLGTETGRQWGEAVMLVEVRSMRGGDVVALAVHNLGWQPMGGDSYLRSARPTKPQVPPALLAALNKHKVGDVIAIRAQTINGTAALHSTKAYQAQSGEFDNDSAFFVKSEQRRMATGRTVTRVTLAKYGKVTVLPLMETRGKDAKGRPTRTTRQDLARAVASLSKGDLVEVDVGTDHGTRVIWHIARWQEPFVGQFARLGQTEIDGAKHMTVTIRSALGGAPLMVQQTSARGAKWRDDFRMTRFVKTLKPNQYVGFKTRRQGDRTILWLIGRTDKTTSKRTVDGAAGGQDRGAGGAPKAKNKAKKKAK